MRSRHARWLVGAAIAVLVALGAASFAVAGGGDGRNGKKDRGDQFTARMIGFNEVPSLNGDGRRTVRLKLAADHIDLQLDFSGLSGPPGAAHVHIGQRGMNGNVSFFFCGGGGKPACPAATAGSISGTVVAANILGPTTQGSPSAISRRWSGRSAQASRTRTCTPRSSSGARSAGS
jgi:hypothetical protein